MTSPRTHAAAVTTLSPEPASPLGRPAYRTPGRTVTIREICETTKRSYGAIRSLLNEAGATKRGHRIAGAEEQVSS